MCYKFDIIQLDNMYIGVFDKILWRTKWSRKVLCGGNIVDMLAQSKIKLGQYFQSVVALSDISS